MKILVLNGSPRKKGAVATLLKAVADGAAERHEVEWIDVYDLDMRPCIACMKCRPDGECVLPEDDAHVVGRKIAEAQGLIVGTPTHWADMSAQLKLLFDRNVPVFMGETPTGIPAPRQKGKPVVVITACSTPWPFDSLANESRGAIRALRKPLHYGGYRILGRLVKPGSRKRPQVSRKLLNRAKRLGRRFRNGDEG